MPIKCKPIYFQASTLFFKRYPKGLSIRSLAWLNKISCYLHRLCCFDLNINDALLLARMCITQPWQKPFNGWPIHSQWNPSPISPHSTASKRFSQSPLAAILKLAPWCLTEAEITCPLALEEPGKYFLSQNLQCYFGPKAPPNIWRRFLL